MKMTHFARLEKTTNQTIRLLKGFDPAFPRDVCWSIGEVDTLLDDG